MNRLKDGQPINVPKGTKITKDAVSLEAGRGKGSIKKSRPVFAQLIAEIEVAAAEQNLPKRRVEQQSDRLKSEIKDLRIQLDAALSRAMSLVYELFELNRVELMALGVSFLEAKDRVFRDHVKRLARANGNQHRFLELV